MLYKKPIVVAEIGCNHRGEMETAKELITVAKELCKADVVKFQKRNVKEVLSSEEYSSPHINPSNSYGCTYGEHREALEFSFEQHKQLMQFCIEKDILYSASVWDMISAAEIISLNPAFIKIPSACNTNFNLIKYLYNNYSGDIHISMGMITRTEEQDIMDFILKSGRAKDTVIYACTSAYPVDFEDTCLLEIERFSTLYGSCVKDIGFSGHHLGISIDIAAYMLGANWIERHFTINRAWKGTDHAASLEPGGLSKLVRDLNATYTSLKYKEGKILEVEKEQRKKLKWDRNLGE